jgi:hypothetical protein
MGNTISNNYDQDRTAFMERYNRNYKGVGNESIRQMELKDSARHGNVYAREQLRQQGLAETSIEQGRGDTAQLSGEAMGKVGDTLESVSDHMAWGAQKNLRKAAQAAGKGNYKEALLETGGAGLRVVGGAGTAYLGDKALGGVLKGGGKVMQTLGKAAPTGSQLQGAGRATQILSKAGSGLQRSGAALTQHHEGVTAVLGNAHSILHPGVEAATSTLLQAR